MNCTDPEILDGDPGDEDKPRWHFGETVMDDYKDSSSTAPMTTFLKKDTTHGNKR
jgi:hypothetical protein